MFNDPGMILLNPLLMQGVVRPFVCYCACIDLKQDKPRKSSSQWLNGLQSKLKLEKKIVNTSNLELRTTTPPLIDSGLVM